MKILFDHQIFNRQRFGGISRHFVEIIKGLKQDPNFEVDLPLVYSENEYTSKVKMSLINSFLGNKLRDNWRFKGKTRIVKQFKDYNSRIAIRRLKKGDFDLFHPTYYDPYFLEHLGNKRFVLTIYDMVHEIFPSYFRRDDRTREWKELLTRRASKIIAVSENTKKDILRFYGVDESKVVVIYLGNSIDPIAKDIDIEHELPEEYVLFVGNRAGYKNFVRLLRAITPILMKNPQLNLLCVGGGKFTEDELTEQRALGVQGKIIHYDANEQSLPMLYKRAKCFIFPSLYEGFGLPILEAFACGCPIGVSNTSSFPEIAGDCAVYFDPTSEASLAEMIEKVLYDEILRKELIQRGYHRVQSFNWNSAGEKMKAVYRSVGSSEDFD